jgi:AraC-like DNA-binding protein
MNPPLIEHLRKNPLRFICGWRGSVTGYYPRHFHTAIELVHHPRGQGTTTLGDGRRLDFVPHSTVIYPVRCLHDQRMSQPGEDICVHVAVPPKAARLFAHPLYIPPPSRKGALRDRFVQDEFHNLSRLRADSVNRVELDFRVTALVARLLHLNPSSAWSVPCSPAEVYLQQARRFIGENYARLTGVGEVARHVGISEDYLRHLFAEQGGSSLNRTLNQIRLERAKELLLHSRLPVKEIAALSGFKTERYLTTRFKRWSGSSPGRFRRESQVKESAITTRS